MELNNLTFVFSVIYFVTYKIYLIYIYTCKFFSLYIVVLIAAFRTDHTEITNLNYNVKF